MGTELKPGEVLAGTYEIVRLVGKGGMGEVYEARHRRLSGRYAIKTLQREILTNEEAFARFRREAEVTSALRHPNIVQVTDFNETASGNPFLAMEFLEGEELAQAIRAAAPLPVARVVDIVGQVALALAATHAMGVTHRDLKPQNIFLQRLPGNDRDHVKVVDFGISKVRQATTKITRNMSILGTPGYMSPEQAEGHVGEIDGRTDEFALATIAYEMLTGQAAFRGETIAAVIYQVVHVGPEPIRALNKRVSEAVEGVVLKGMAKRREDRYSTPSEFHQELKRAAEEAPGPDLRAMFAPTVRPESVAAESAGRSEAARGSKPGPGGAGRQAGQLVAVSTTIRSSSGEVVSAPAEGSAAPASSRSRPVRVGALLFAGVAAATAAVWLASSRSGDSSPPTQTSAGPTGGPAPVAAGNAGEGANPRPDSVTIDVVDAPPGVLAKLDGVVVDMPIRLARGATKRSLTFEAPGYEPLPFVLDGLRPVTLSLRTMRQVPTPGGGPPEGRSRPGPDRASPRGTRRTGSGKGSSVASSPKPVVPLPTPPPPAEPAAPAPPAASPPAPAKPAAQPAGSKAKIFRDL